MRVKYLAQGNNGSPPTEKLKVRSTEPLCNVVPLLLSKGDTFKFTINRGTQKMGCHVIDRKAYEEQINFC